MSVHPSYDTLWRKRLDALNAVWPGFLAGETEALHKTRVASRRLREALPVVGASAPSANVKKLRRKLRQVTRFLGPIRELDVELAMLEKEAAAGGVSRAALALVRREVAARRHALRHRLKKDPPVGDIKKLTKKLSRISGSKDKGQQANGQQGPISSGKAEKARKQEESSRAALGARLLRRARQLKAALDDAGPLYTPERIHGVRVGTKKFRYALEIAQDAGIPRAKALVAVLKREQERLGHLHDLQMLLKRVREAEVSPRAGTRLAGLSAYADLLERDCRRVHAAFVEHRDAIFQCIKEVRQELVPSLATTDFRQAPVIPVRQRVRGRGEKRA